MAGERFEPKTRLAKRPFQRRLESGSCSCLDEPGSAPDPGLRQDDERKFAQKRATPIGRAGSVLVLALVALPCPAPAAQFDIQGPPGSGRFGSRVAVLPNSNIVVTDPWFSTSSANHAGAIYLYDPSGTLISVLTGSQDDDEVGGGRIVVLATGHFVVSSPGWNNASAADAGAVTWIDATTGLSGVVSAQNSLVGSSANDTVGGYQGVVPLTNGHYVVASPAWSNGGVQNVGAVTWGNGSGGTVGAASASNSLVGTDSQDSVGEAGFLAGGVVALPNGNYVVPSVYWHYATRKNFGAMTWGNGQGGTVGTVSSQNSLLGTTNCLSDQGGPSQITVLGASNYLVASPCWSHGAAIEAGAVTWLDGSQPTSGEVATQNSLIGTSSSDRIGIFRATVLANGNYVVLSSFWNSGTGAATWIDGTKAGLAGTVSPGNSLVGSTPGDYVGISATALANGHYVVGSPEWSSPDVPRVGAVTWANGTAGLVGPVSASNSLIGSTPNDVIGSRGIAALANGNYVVASPYWCNGPLADVGAVTVVDGSGPVSGLVTSGNSLTGSQANDGVGSRGVSVLPNGGFVVLSPEWNNGTSPKAGAVTWGDGSTAFTGIVSSSNSLVGTNANDSVGASGIVVLANGNFVASSYNWSDGGTAAVGAATWADGGQGRTGVVSSANSLVGSQAYDYVGSQLTALADGRYLVASSRGQSGFSIGSLTLVDGNLGATGTLQPWNTLFADIRYATYGREIAYDAARGWLVVGRPHANIVTLFSIADAIFAAGFE